jgi:hypothetical protein
MKTRHVLAITLGLIMLLGAVVPSSAAEPVTANYWLDASGGSLSCSGDWVEITGRIHIVDAVVLNATGGSTLEHHINLQMSGVGQPSGARYRLSTVSNEHSTVAFDDAPYVYTSISRSQMVGSGPDNNDVYWQVLHTTINADGTVISEVDRSGWECK